MAEYKIEGMTVAGKSVSGLINAGNFKDANSLDSAPDGRTDGAGLCRAIDLFCNLLPASAKNAPICLKVSKMLASGAVNLDRKKRLMEVKYTASQPD